MEIYNRDEVNLKKINLFSLINNGKVFIYPTDTIYGIGCDATNELAVNKVRELKSRVTNPFSIIAPSVSWIRENCFVDEKVEEWLEKLPGPYTLILKLKNAGVVASSVNNGLNSIGVRIPNHWISEFVSDLKVPIVTTSANKQGNNFMTSIEDIDIDIKANINFMIYEGELVGSPSTLVILNTDQIAIKKR